MARGTTEPPKERPVVSEHGGHSGICGLCWTKHPLPVEFLGLSFFRKCLTSVRCPDTKATQPEELHPKFGSGSSLMGKCTSSGPCATSVSLHVSGPWNFRGDPDEGTGPDCQDQQGCLGSLPVELQFSSCSLEVPPLDQATPTGDHPPAYSLKEPCAFPVYNCHVPWHLHTQFRSRHRVEAP